MNTSTLASRKVVSRFGSVVLLGLISWSAYYVPVKQKVIAKYHCEACVVDGVKYPDTWHVQEETVSLLGRKDFDGRDVSEAVFNQTVVVGL